MSPVRDAEAAWCGVPWVTVDESAGVTMDSFSTTDLGRRKIAQTMAAEMTSMIIRFFSIAIQGAIGKGQKARSSEGGVPTGSTMAKLSWELKEASHVLPFCQLPLAPCQLFPEMSKSRRAQT